ncbi:MAG TPA: type VI secretion system tip protein TssI/VgrG, partial [Minicystis sp.]|nr:type VI secretion system tip protein TssI/VgrG [Minicystis sp.]
MTASNADGGFEISLASSRFDCEGLRVRALSGVSAISRLFAFDVDAVSVQKGGLDVARVLGEPVTIVFSPNGGGDVTRVHGIVAGVDDDLAEDDGVRAYRLRVMPRAERLALGAAQEISMGLGVPDILAAKLAAVGLTPDADVAMRLQGTYAAREFVVQYKETDLAFLCRLAEHVGISFYFDHQGEADRMIFTDFAGGFSDGEAPREHRFRGRGEQRDVFQLKAEHRLVPRSFTVHDYNYRLPQVAPLGAHELADGVGYAGDVIEYGAHVKTPEEARALAKVRAEERQADQLVYVGRSALPSLQAGVRCRVTGHPELDAVELLIVEVRHEATQGLGHAEVRSSYVNTFRAIPADRTYRPPRVTPRPRIHGLVTGIIADVGAAGATTGGSTVYAPIDEQGRYAVRFLFDTAGEPRRAPSHPVRMLQQHAGAHYGTHFPLRPGVEVLIAFIDGDPDRPLIVGAVPNPLTPSPVTNARSDVHTIKTATGTRIECK